MSKRPICSAGHVADASDATDGKCQRKTVEEIDPDNGSPPFSFSSICGQPMRPLEPEVRRVGQDHTSSDFELTSIPGWERRGDLWVDLAAPEHRPVTTSVALARSRKDREGKR